MIYLYQIYINRKMNIQITNIGVLTVIIPFLNEGDEIRNTVRSIRNTALGNPHILLINDASTDNYPYEKVALEENCIYIVNKERNGIAASRDKGIDVCTTPYFLFLDGHMRFYEQGWDLRLVDLLRAYPEAILCGQTKRLEKDKEGNIVSLIHRTCYGAYIKMNVTDLFKATWRYVEVPFSNNTCIEVVCILGAAYAGNKKYWLYLHGLKGLMRYGSDEEMLSTKVWCAGGRCLLVKDWIVGHIYRNSFPYEISSVEMVYNRLFILELFYPYSVKRNLFLNLRKKYENIFEQAYDLLRINYHVIRKEKRYWRSISKQSIEDFVLENNSLRQKDID